MSVPHTPRLGLQTFLPARLLAGITPLFVWGTWSAMLLFVLFCIVRYGRDIPLAEDWHVVPALTGNETDFWGWLWAQNNEHRVPLPRLLLLSLVWLSGDFRAGMVFNALALGAAAFAMILIARHLRGHVAYTDAFFPLVLLHMGHWENLVWSWQVQFVSSMLLTTLFLLFIARYGARPPAGVAIAAGVGLLMLPLVGANGLAVVPAGALWLVYLGFLRWREAALPGRHLALALWVVSALGLLLVPLYFLGYEKPTWNPPSPGLAESLLTSGKFLAMSVGPVAARSWALFILVTLSLVLVTGFVLLRGLKHEQTSERRRALGLALFLGTFMLLVLAMGWGRAGLVPTAGMPARYALFAAPVLIWAYYVWELYGPRKLSQVIHTGLLLLMLILLPFNTLKGFSWRNWYTRGMKAVEADIAAGLTPAMLAERHRAFLLHWDQGKLEDGIRMLQEAGIGPFGQPPAKTTPPLESADPTGQHRETPPSELDPRA
jgi:hypothetical protein